MAIGRKRPRRASGSKPLAACQSVFSDRNDLGHEFSEDLAARFLEEFCVGDKVIELRGQGWRKHVV